MAGRQGLSKLKSMELSFAAGFIGGKAVASANSELLIFKEITYLASLFYANKKEFRELTTDLGRIHFCTCSAGAVHDRS